MLVYQRVPYCRFFFCDFVHGDDSNPHQETSMWNKEDAMICFILLETVLYWLYSYSLWLFCSFRMILIPIIWSSVHTILSSCLTCFFSKVSYSFLLIKVWYGSKKWLKPQSLHDYFKQQLFHRLWSLLDAKAFRQNPCDAGFQDIAWHSDCLAFLFCCGYSGGHYLCLRKCWCSTWTGWTTHDCTRCLKNLKDIKHKG